MLLTLAALAVAATPLEPVLAWEVDVYKVDSPELGQRLEAAASCRPPALQGADASRLALAAVADRPGIVRISDSQLSSRYGETVRLVVGGPEHELEVSLDGEVPAPGLLELHLELRLEESSGSTHRREQQWRMADGHRLAKLQGGLLVMVRARIVHGEGVQPWSDPSTGKALVQGLIGDREGEQRLELLDRMLASCNATEALSR